LANLTVITGGARSGKSKFAESLAARGDTQVVYIATMERLVCDPEAVERIQRHRDRRPPHWLTVEQPVDAHKAVDALFDQTRSCIFDCLSLYVSNLLLDGYDETLSMAVLEEKILGAAEELLRSISCKSQTHFYVVTNEVGWGVVPENGLARSYRDLLGLTNQLFARSASEVWLSCLGLQLKLKPQAHQP
jgi:adenosylcobinamide kinase/adenosylcobinamide-phosphate guanylyltransferase